MSERKWEDELSVEANKSRRVPPNWVIQSYDTFYEEWQDEDWGYDSILEHASLEQKLAESGSGISYFDTSTPVKTHEYRNAKRRILKLDKEKNQFYIVKETK